MPVSNLSGKTCLVLGATGFIGWNLCRHLVSQGARVRAVVHRTISDEQRRDPDIAWRQGSFSDRDFMARTLEGQSVVFHLISTSSPGRYNTDPLADLRENVEPTLQLAELAIAAGVDRLVFTSSGGTVYGISRDVFLNETSQANPISCYGVGKLASEKYLEIFARYLGLKSTILRISNPYGPYQFAAKGQGLIGKVISCGLNRETLTIWGDGSVVRDFIYIDDVVSALTAAAGYEGPEHVFNVGSGVGASVIDVIAAVQRATGLAIEVDYQPGRAADVPVNVLDTSLIRSSLKWRPRVSLEDGLRLTYAWNAARPNAIDA
ncbi:NAD-dependent epimerase/dehydratase family protein [Methylobacterium sp. J-068]|uniref:NAD-dependent epimerase/dehydratase family protein n=1 Tax=Methylobacterium sp. J-068 TaxID=2836649 RepID=UPI001FBA3569|nr:NAD-dependent epimerase/dehydratase family protein [Methylobacterium sp. J-068]MCJ2037178.1 NAD-dependent epimerase/dehydratase family protein [Methylobacterium sp. J-068]